MELNGTKIKIQPHFFPQYLEEAQKYKVESVIQEILVVPGMLELIDFASPFEFGFQNYKLGTLKYFEANK